MSLEDNTPLHISVVALVRLSFNADLSDVLSCIAIWHVLQVNFCFTIACMTIWGNRCSFSGRISNTVAASFFASQTFEVLCPNLPGACWQLIKLNACITIPFGRFFLAGDVVFPDLSQLFRIGLKGHIGCL